MLIRVKKKNLDFSIRNKLKNSELQRKYLKYLRLISLIKLNKNNYVNYQTRLKELPLVRFNNSCYLTNRGRGVLRNFRVSRHQLREKFRFIPGLINSSW